MRGLSQKFRRGLDHVGLCGEKYKHWISIPSNFHRAMAYYGFYLKTMFWLLSGEWNKNGENEGRSVRVASL